MTGQIEASVTASLERLKRDSVMLLQLHNQLGAETRGRMIAAGEVLKPGGMLDVLECGRIASAQVYFNLLNPTAGCTMPSP